ncbi:amidase [Streptomyces griseochromogenes]|uniref:amidase n=1 Tax=Streptomyces griseochromogenes TaxID=68214 RepID=UPI0037B1833F
MHREMKPDVVENVTGAVARADRWDRFLGTFLQRCPDEALAAAERLVRRGDNGRVPLFGVLIAVKDVIAIREGPTTAQSRVFDPAWWRGRDAGAVSRLRSAGAIVLGKTSMAEHAIGRPDPTAPPPVPRNPWDLERWTGGSSCGSANGIGHGLFTIGIGTDSNGSLRVPAAFCGVTGFKPTAGATPQDGCLALCPSLDTVGPTARTVRDCERALSAMAAGAAVDLGRPVRWREDLRAVRVGVPAELLEQDADITDDCRTVFAEALRHMKDLGAEVVPIEFSEYHPLLAAHLITVLVEAFGSHRDRLRRHWTELGRSFRRAIVLGGLLTPEAYERAQTTRRHALGLMRERFRTFDAVATPTWPTTAPRLDDPAALRQISGLPGIWNALGCPAVALPMGFGADDQPLSLQLAGAPGDDLRLAEIADVYQRRTGWHLRTPPPIDEQSTPTARTPPWQPPPPEETASSPRLRRALTAIGITVEEDDLAALEKAWPGIAGLPGHLQGFATATAPENPTHRA